MVKMLTIVATIYILSSYVTAQNCSSTQVYTPSDDAYIFSLLPLNKVTLWDGPAKLSGATVSESTKSWAENDLKYYNYFAASMYCSYKLSDLSCCYCHHFSGSVTYHKIIENSIYDTKALITLHPSREEIVLTFRGSVAIINWVMDFTLLPVHVGRNIQIHKGFHHSLMSIYNEVVQEIGGLINANPGYRVVITGHSLGGSMASLFTFFMKYLNQFPATSYALVSFGEMRTGNKGYADYMDSLTIPVARVVARADIIPHIIPVSVFGLLQLLLSVYYVHHGQEVWIDGHTTKFCSVTRYEDFSCSNKLGPTYTILDHLQYFDADYSVCYFIEGWLDIDLVTLPGGWTPTSYLPPMPTVMEDLALPIFQGGYQGLLPLV